MPNDIQLALDEIHKHHEPRRTLAQYYDGIHAFAFATEKFKNAFGKTIQSMRDNLCPIVVDSIADRLEVINFSGDGAGKKTDTNAWDLWQSSQMELVSNTVHTDALKTGEGFVIVWPDKTGKAHFYPQNPLNCAVVVDVETEEPQFGAKLWKADDEKYRLNIFYADRTEKYVTKQKPNVEMTGLKAEHFTTFAGTDAGESGVNSYGIVPMFKFEAPPVLSDAIPIQDALNKTLCDKLVAMEFTAFPQRWATGLEVPKEQANGLPGVKPFEPGPDRLWFTEDPTTKFGAFPTADLTQFLKVADSYRLEMARVSGTPLHFFSINTSDAISGEALKTLESRFTKRITRLGLSFGPVWARAMQLALKIENKPVSENLTVQWQPAEQRSEKEYVETLGLKRANLDIPVSVLQSEFGYSDEDIAKFKTENDKAAAEVADQMTADTPGNEDAATNAATA